MSELAKFVAATLQERVAVDLEEENKALRTKNEGLESERTKTFEYASRSGRVEITGKDGVPVYAYGEMKHSELYDDDDDLGLPDNLRHRFLLLDDDREESTQCPIDKLKEVEIRLNGLLVAILSECDESKISACGQYNIDPDGLESVYKFNPETHNVGGLWNSKTLELHLESTHLLRVSFDTIVLEAVE